MSGKRWVRRPEGSNWGAFGPDDQLGRVNLITPDKVLQAIAEVRTGRTFCLSLPLDLPGGSALSARRHPPRLEPTLRDGQPNANFPMDRVDPRYVDLLCDDKVTLCTQYSTQWDALGHVGARFDADGDGIPEGRYYNGFRAEGDIHGPVRYDKAGEEPTGEAYSLAALGIEHMAVHGLQGRGVMLDLEAHFGRERRRIGAEALMEVMDKDRVVVEPGDMLCLHTGFADMILAARGNPDPAALASSCCVLDGRDPALARWITESGIAAIASDNYAVEAFPAPDPEPAAEDASFSGLPLHHHCLFKLGLPFGELWYLTELARWLRQAGRSRFLLTAPPLRLPGAAGSPVTPIATV